MSEDDGDGHAFKAAFDKVERALRHLNADERIRLMHAIAIVFGIEKALLERLSS